MSSQLDKLAASTATGERPADQPPPPTSKRRQAEPPPPAPHPDPVPVATVDEAPAPAAKKAPNKRKPEAVKKRTVPLRVTIASEQVIRTKIDDPSNQLDTYGAVLIDALRHSAGHLRENAPDIAAVDDEWADETDPQRQLVAPAGERLAELPFRLSPRQVTTLDNLCSDLGWSRSLTADAAIRLRFELD